MQTHNKQKIDRLGKGNIQLCCQIEFGVYVVPTVRFTARSDVHGIFGNSLNFTSIKPNLVRVAQIARSFLRQLASQIVDQDNRWNVKLSDL